MLQHPPVTITNIDLKYMYFWGKRLFKDSLKGKNFVLEVLLLLHRFACQFRFHGFSLGRIFPHHEGFFIILTTRLETIFNHQPKV